MLGTLVVLIEMQAPITGVMKCFWRPFVVLGNLSPSAENGQKYILTYVIYNGSTQDESMSVIKTDGVLG